MEEEEAKQELSALSRWRVETARGT